MALRYARKQASQLWVKYRDFFLQIYVVPPDNESYEFDYLIFDKLNLEHITLILRC